MNAESEDIVLAASLVKESSAYRIDANLPADDEDARQARGNSWIDLGGRGKIGIVPSEKDASSYRILLLNEEDLVRGVSPSIRFLSVDKNFDEKIVGMARKKIEGDVQIDQIQIFLLGQGALCRVSLPTRQMLGLVRKVELPVRERTEVRAEGVQNAKEIPAVDPSMATSRTVGPSFQLRDTIPELPLRNSKSPQSSSNTPSQRSNVGGSESGRKEPIVYRRPRSESIPSGESRNYDAESRARVRTEKSSSSRSSSTGRPVPVPSRVVRHVERSWRGRAGHAVVSGTGRRRG